jgi:hypothetical protein
MYSSTGRQHARRLNVVLECRHMRSHADHRAGTEPACLRASQWSQLRR